MRPGVSGLVLVTALVLGCGVEGQIARAEKALQASNLEEAERRYRRVLDKDPDRIEALYGLGWAYHLEGKTASARDWFVRCRRVAPEDYRGEKGLGSIALAEGNLRLAEQHFQAALALAPEEPSVLNSLSLTHMAGRRYEEALALLEGLVSATPHRGEYRLNLAEAQYRLALYEEALQSVDEALGRQIRELRFKALLLHLRARTLLAMTSGRLDPADCAGTLPPILAWLDRAGRDLDRAEDVGIPSEELLQVRHKLHRRRSILAETCPVPAVGGSGEN